MSGWEQRTVIHPLPAEYAFPESMKGQRGCILPGERYEPQAGEEYVRLVKCYFNWNELERTAADGPERIRQVTDDRLAGCREANIRYIPRVAIQWPNHGDTWQATRTEYFCAEDMLPSVNDTPQFLARVRNLVEKLGDVWDRDPRIAYVETGIYGLWGEQHDPFMSGRAQENLAEAFQKAFPNTRCMVRYPRDCIGGGFGSYWDSFAHIDEQEHARDTVRLMDWRRGVMGGEVAHNWGNHMIEPGKDMNDTLTDPAHLNRFLDYVFWLHNNHLGMRVQQDSRRQKAMLGLAEYQKRAGHRFEITEAAYAISGNRLCISLKVRNTGASPFYYDWPVTVGLLDSTKKPVWQAAFSGVRISGWLPGDHWSFEKREYKVKPLEYSMEEVFYLPDLTEGIYFLAAAIPDPSCGLPNALFATRQYFNGGWHPIGYLGIGRIPNTPMIAETLFDDQRSDDSIHY